MSCDRLTLYNSDGRMRGAYVYMLLCDVDDLFYIKIGMSIDPIRRLSELKTACPFKARTLAVCNFWSHEKALIVERALHKEMREYRSQGEWFAFKKADKEKFNSLWKTVFSRECKGGSGLGWTKLSVKELDRIANARRFLWLKKFKSRGVSYRDFVGQSS